jgi:hypothetical protein
MKTKRLIVAGVCGVLAGCLNKGGIMRKLFLVVWSLCMSASAMAQGKVDSQWNCGKATVGHSMEVGDQPGHAYAIGQYSCTAAKGELEGLKEKEGVLTQFDDVKETASQYRGVFVDTLANGEKVYVSYEGATTIEKGEMQSFSDAWFITDGTGRFKGAKGKGTCKGKFNLDGSFTFACAGNYTLAK